MMHLATKLRELWQSEGWPYVPMDGQDLAHGTRHRGWNVPETLLELHRIIRGVQMDDFTMSERHIRVWPLDELELIEVGEDAVPVVLFADYLLRSHDYGLLPTGEVALVFDDDIDLLAPDLATFLSYYLENDPRAFAPAQSRVAPDGSSSLAPSGDPYAAPRVNAGIGPESDDGDDKDGQ